jgi:hypothetical protein
MAGAAMTTSGNIVAQDNSQDTVQFRKKLPVAIDGKLAIPAAIKDVNPDWMTPTPRRFTGAKPRGQRCDS